jgi:transcriptional regulator with XRE-family HTH domain
MEETKMSTYRLAEYTGMSRQTIIFYLKGERSPSIDSLEIILTVFKKHIKIEDD